MLKKSVIIAALFAILLSSCSSENTSNAAVQSEASNPSYEELEAQLDSVIEERDSLQAELDSLKAQIEAEKEETVLNESDVTVTVTGKSVTPMDGLQRIFADYVHLIFSVTNNTEKDIQGIQGQITVKDLFGVEIMTVGCDFTGTIIPSKQTVTGIKLSYECNLSDDADEQLFNERFEDLKFAYTVTQIVFTDGTIKNERIKS